MRQYKFRGFSKTEKVWVYGSLNQYDDGEVLITDSAGKRSWFVYPESVGLFIGFNDTAGIEIFEGDVVLCRFRTIIFKSKIVFNLQIGAFQICYKNGNTSFVTDFFTNYELAVIGNTYEHPDMVKLTPLELDPKTPES